MSEYITPDQYQVAMRVVFPALALILGAMFVLWKTLYYEIHQFRHDVRRQSERSDKLYQMFIDLLKDRK